MRPYHRYSAVSVVTHYGFITAFLDKTYFKQTVQGLPIKITSYPIRYSFQTVNLYELTNIYSSKMFERNNKDARSVKKWFFLACVTRGRTIISDSYLLVIIVIKIKHFHFIKIPHQELFRCYKCSKTIGICNGKTK